MSQEAPGRRSIVGELVMAAAFLGLAGLIFQQTRTVFAEAGAAEGGAMQNAAMYPEFLAGTLVVLALLQIARTLSGVRAALATGADAHLSQPDRRRQMIKALVCSAAFTVYLLVLRMTGYHLATPVLMAVFYFTLGVRNPLVAALVGTATSLLMSLFFEFGLNVILPVGRFGIGF